MDAEFIKIDTWGFVEVMAAPRKVAGLIMFRYRQQNPAAKLTIITEEEAFKELYPDKVGYGCFVSNPYNILDNEERRIASQDKLDELVISLGITSYLSYEIPIPECYSIKMIII